MKGIRDLLMNILGNLSDAAAIINHTGSILYANGAFGDRFSLSEHARLPNSPLVPLLGGDARALNEGLAKRELALFQGHETCTMNVYLLDTPRGGERQYLLLPRHDMNNDLLKTPGLTARPDVKSDHDKFPIEELSPEFKGLVGEDVSFRRALLIAQKAAKSDLPVLILGESGTGKEIVAQAIHRTSRRSNKQLVDVNCAAIPDTLIESELFGYEKGAFTGARTEGRSGYFEVAHGGTLLMDEIGDASLQSQSKLLRVLEDGCFKRVGGSRNVKVDVRIISSTNKDLRKNIVEKTFREDLFYRLNTFTIQLPSLRERVRDIPLLINHFLALNTENDRRSLKFHSSAMDILQAYHWPGNVRELKGVVNYAVNMSSRSIIDPGALPSFLFPQWTYPPEETDAEEPVSADRQSVQLMDAVQQVEREIMKDALEKSVNRTAAIKRLGISRRTFYIKIKQYGLG